MSKKAQKCGDEDGLFHGMVTRVCVGVLSVVVNHLNRKKRCNQLISLRPFVHFKCFVGTIILKQIYGHIWSMPRSVKLIKLPQRENVSCNFSGKQFSE